MNTQLLALLKLDLIMTGINTIQLIECPYSINEDWSTAMTKVYHATRQASKRKKRLNALIYAFYMGKLIETSVTPKEKWLEFVHQKSIENGSFIYKGVTRTYQLFKSDKAQIYHTQHMTLRRITRLSNQKFNELVAFKESNEEDFVI
jgi:hypothetical protein